MSETTLVKTDKRITSQHFQLSQNTTGQWWLRALDKDVEPKAKRVKPSDARYLFECGNEFDNACIFDYGVGVFQK